MRELPRIVAETKIGTSAEVVVWRAEREKEFTVTLGELDEKEEEQAATPSSESDTAPKGEKLLGMTLAPVDEATRKQFSLGKKQEGVVVLDVAQSSAAATRGIARGDVIIGVGQEDVVSVDALKQAIEGAKSDGKKFALLRVQRDKTATFVTLPTSEEEKKKE